MVVALTEDRRASAAGESIIKTISTRLAGGKQISTAPSQVIVNMREFRSTLPSLLHAARLLVVPATLTVGALQAADLIDRVRRAQVILLRCAL